MIQGSGGFGLQNRGDEAKEHRPARALFDFMTIGLVVGILTIIHYTNYHYEVGYHILLQFAYYLPVIYAAMRFGLVGGIVSSFLITILFIPLMLHFQKDLTAAARYTQWVEVGLINVFGWLTGFLTEEERKTKNKYRLALKVQKDLVAQLKQEEKERQRLEAEIRQTERIAALGHLSAGLAHEIRNPLGIMKVSIQMLAQEKCGDEVVAEYCQVLSEECERLNRMLSEFLSFARPKELVRERILLGKLVEESLALIQPVLGKNHIQLEQIWDAALNQEVEVDPDQIKQVILNIFLNAVDAQEKGGVIRLEGIEEEGFIGFAVSDEGTGISSEDMPFIYDPFFTTKEKGTGLGLSVVHRILDQHGGKIRTFNRAKQGVTVKILLPTVPVNDDNTC